MKWMQLFGAAALAATIVALPTPDGLSVIGHRTLAITIFTVVLWALQVMNNGVTSVLMMALLAGAGVRPAAALSGFSTPQFWILLSVLFYGFAMQKTGLARRVAFQILQCFPATYGGIVSAFLVIGLVLALGIPSMTVRTAIVVPIAWSLVQSVGLTSRSAGAALIMIGAVEMAVLPGCAFLYGSLYGPVVESLFRAKGLELTWLGYSAVMTVPTLMLCTLVLVLNDLTVRPREQLVNPMRFASGHLQSLGGFTRHEVITAAVVVVSVVYWATDRFHHQPAFLVGMLALPLFSMSGILEDSEIGTAIPWSLLLFLGGIFSLSTVIQETRVIEWLARFLVPVARELTFSPTLFVLALAVAMFFLKFTDPGGFIAITVLFLPISDVSTAVGIHPVVLVGPLVLAASPFWLSYQNIWIAMTEALTANQAFGTAQRVRLAFVYAGACILVLILSVGYWRTAGIL